MYREYGEAIARMTRSVFVFFGGSFVVMVVEAFIRRFRERNSWKGREIKFE